MSVLVMGAGRTGTNMLLEIVAGSSRLETYRPYVDISPNFLNSHPDLVHEKFLSKCDTIGIVSLERLHKFINDNSELKILFTVRDWRDAALSKIYRGQPGQDGNRRLAADASVEGCLIDIFWSKVVYDYLKQKIPNRVKLVKMEDIILNSDTTIKDVCKFCEIPYEEDMLSFNDRYGNPYKKERYKKGFDKKQVGLYKRVDELYEGFFKTHNADLDFLFNELGQFLDYYDYERGK
tara:strand:+ start:2300 stop:3004 length:705 start_codon:yes stop_codon:yes gene_type:complete